MHIGDAGLIHHFTNIGGMDMIDISGLIPLAAYIVMALGVFWMGQACGVKNPWLSFIPVGSDYALGCLAEKSAGRGTRESKPYRKILMGLSITVLVLVFVTVCAAVVFLLGVVGDLDWDWAYILSDTDAFVQWLETVLESTTELEIMEEAIANNVGSLLVTALAGLALSVVAIVYMVYYFVSLNHVYNLFDEKNAKLWTVLSVVGALVVPYVGTLVAPVLLLVLSRTKKPALDEEEPDVADPGSEPWQNL